MQRTEIIIKKVKFATQADPDLLDQLRNLANTEGRQIQALLDEALREYLQRKQENSPRKAVMEAFHASLEEYDSLYQELTK